VEIVICNNNFIILCELIKGFDIKVIEIPYHEAYKFMKDECEDNLEILVSKL